MKKKPETIADLKFNWTFELFSKSVERNRIQFEELNPDLLKYRIKPGDYKLQYLDRIIWFYVTSSEPLFHLIEHVDYELYLKSKESPVNFKPLKLLKFELISETEFKIHVEESKE